MSSCQGLSSEIAMVNNLLLSTRLSLADIVGKFVWEGYAVIVLRKSERSNSQAGC